MQQHEGDEAPTSVFFRDWVSVWDCPRINLKLLSGAALKEVKDSIALCLFEKEASASFEAKFRDPLIERINEFVDSAQEKVKDIECVMEALAKDIADIRVSFGEEATLENPADDPCQSFFVLFCEAMKKYSAAYKQTMEWKETAARAERRKVAEEKRKSMMKKVVPIVAFKHTASTVTNASHSPVGAATAVVNDNTSGVSGDSNTVAGDVFDKLKASQLLTAEEYISKYFEPKSSPAVTETPSSAASSN
jgi:hypothetical protein